MSTVIESIEQSQLRKVPRFAAGDRVRVHFLVIEGNRQRTQVFEGVVIKRQGSGARETFTVRKQSFGVGVERTFPLHSPKIEQLEVAARGDVRRAKLYYLRDRIGKAARVAERRWGIADELVIAEDAAAGAVDSEGITQAEIETEQTREEADAAAAEGSAEETASEGVDSGGVAGEAGAEQDAAESEPSGETTEEAESEPSGETTEEAESEPSGETTEDAESEADGEEP